MYDRVLYLNPNFLTAIFNKGRTYEKMGKHSDAIDCYAKILSIDPNNIMAKKDIGRCELLIGQK